MDYVHNMQPSGKYLSHYPSDLSEKLFTTVDEGIMITDKNLKIVHVNPAFEFVTGYTREEVLGHSPSIIQSGIHPKSFYIEMWNEIEIEGKWSGEIWNCRKNGELFPEWLTIMEIKDELGNVTNYCGIFVDLSDKEGAVKYLKTVALTDPLTQLGNRQSYAERMESLLDKGDGKNYRHAVLFLDLDRFKQINDTLGHHIGDKLLEEFGRRIKSTLKNRDILARYGGDEFVITITGIKHMREAAHMAKKITQSLETAFHIDSHELYISTSIGISLYPQDGKTMEELLKKADKAMYESKRIGRNQFTFYYPELENDQSEFITIETELFNAIEQKAFTMHYQPIVHLKTSEVKGVEAFIQWDNPKLNTLKFTDFNSLMDELNISVYITNIVLDQICRDILYFINEGIEFGSVVVDLTHGYLIQPNVIPNILAILEKHNISSKHFTFEVIEEALMFDLDRSTELLNKLKRLGFGLGIDHFGKGLSSIAYLPKFEIDYMKIDDGFIKEILESDVNRTIVDTITHLAHRLGLRIIADGIVNRSQFELIRELNCDAAQGEYFSKAIKKEELRKYLELMNVIV